MHSAANRWFITYQSRPNARLRLFCIPFAGGGASVFYSWGKDLPVEIELCSLQLPGHENRYAETPFTRIEPLIQVLGQALRPYLDRPFAFFGHSMGALIVFELTRYFRKTYHLLPVHLLVSALRSPQDLYQDSHISDLPAEAFVEQIITRYDAIPEAIINDPNYMRFLLPTMRADFGIVEKYTYHKEDPLDCPIATFGGNADKAVPLRSLIAWKEQTTRDFSLKLFHGGHFFLQEERIHLLELITRLLVKE